MVNFDEILLLGIGILSLGFLNKNREDPSVQTGGMAKPFVNPYLDKLQTAQVSALNQLGTSKENLENIRLNNLEIAQNILNVERQKADLNIDYIQSNLQEARTYVSEQQKNIISSSGLSKDQSYWSNQLGGIKNYAESILRGFAQTQNVGGKNVRDLRYLDSPELRQTYQNVISQENIEKVEPFILSSEQKIIDLNAEYTNKYGDISRYS
jgi:hypothetical protein|tara:strand:- start:469 stop:1098 length:630 start_codon:yes stop_codon:yes gene_type:complete